MKEKHSNVFELIKKHPVALIMLLLAFTVPIYIKDIYLRRMLFEIYIYAALGSAWNILGGFARQISWASGTFFSVGAYTAMVLFIHRQISPWIGLFGGIAISIVLAIIIGVPTLRLRGVYFAIATIACEGTITQIWKNLDLVGRNNGITLPKSSGTSFADMSFGSDLPFYYISLIWMLVTVVIAIWINRSRLGYYLKSIRDDEDAAIAMGLRTHRIKLITLVISAVLMAITGAFYAFKLRSVNPSMVATHDISVKIAICAIIGGIGTISGPVLGAFAVVALFELVNAYLATLGGGGAGYLVYGLMMMLVVIFRPRGLISLWEPIKKVLFGRKKEVVSE
jgi:branched-chain amino acid transport system permease protein